MTKRAITIGSLVNYHVYDDNSPDHDPISKAIQVAQPIFVDAPPVDPEDVLRLNELGGLQPSTLSVADITAPVELNALTGSVTSFKLVFEVDTGPDNVTLYRWDAAVSSGANPPFIVAGLSGFWTAIAGRYIAGSCKLESVLYVGDSSVQHDGTDLLIDPRVVSATGVVDVKGPIKISDVGALLSTPQAGTFEFDDDRMYLTNVNSQRAIDTTGHVIVSTLTVSNTAVETTLFSGSIIADELKVGNVVKFQGSGILSTATAADDPTLNVYIGTNLIGTFTPAIGLVTDDHWHVEFDITIRTVGAAGTFAFHGNMHISTFEDFTAALGSIDTTGTDNLTIKVLWPAAKVGNTISIYTGYDEIKG